VPVGGGAPVQEELQEENKNPHEAHDHVCVHIACQRDKRMNSQNERMLS
jgi:hypothetical protein